MKASRVVEQFASESAARTNDPRGLVGGVYDRPGQRHGGKGWIRNCRPEELRLARLYPLSFPYGNPDDDAAAVWQQLRQDAGLWRDGPAGTEYGLIMALRHINSARKIVG